MENEVKKKKLSKKPEENRKPPLKSNILFEIFHSYKRLSALKWHTSLH